ncbi:MAG: hypothetical protein ACI4PW_01715 [Alphaproteobacteria bacterium]|jgi:hypothetical protein
MKRLFLTGLGGLMLGFGAGLLYPSVFPAVPEPPLGTAMTSEGRHVLNEFTLLLKDRQSSRAAAAASEEIRALQSAARKEPDQEGIRTHLAKASEERTALQDEFYRLFGEALMRMPETDRRLYLKAYLSRKKEMREDLIFPSLARMPEPKEGVSTGRPRDKVFRRMGFTE